MRVFIILFLFVFSFPVFAVDANCHAGDACDQSLLKQYLKKISEFEICPKDSKAFYCLPFGTDEKVDIKEKKIQAVDDKKLTAVGSCPSPLVSGKFELSYKSFCDFSEKVKDFVLAAFGLSALFIAASSVLRGI